MAAEESPHLSVEETRPHSCHTQEPWMGRGHSCDSASWRPWALLAPPRHDFPHQHPQHKQTLPCGPTFTPVRSGPKQPLLWGQASDCPPPSPSPCASPGLGGCRAPITPHLFLSLTAAPPFPEALLSPTDPSRTPCPGFPASCPPSSPRIRRLHGQSDQGEETQGSVTVTAGLQGPPASSICVSLATPPPPAH